MSTMIKTLKLFLFIATLCGIVYQVNAQTMVGNQIPTTLQITSYGSTQNALVSLPDDYNETTGKYPLLIFLHGSGEVGKSVGDLSKEIKAGLPLVISLGYKIQAYNPRDGKPYKFIVISPQHWGWTTTPESLLYMLATLPRKYRIDTTRIYLTGLSAGGQGVIQAVTYSQALTNKIAAIVPMSTSATDNNFAKKFGFFSQSKTAAWFFAGTNKDEPYLTNTKKYSDSINRYNPGSSKVTVTGSLNGHCCWDAIYNPIHRENGLNIYEWMLQYTTGGNDTVPPAPASYSITIPNAQDIGQLILIMKDGRYVQYDSTSIPSLKTAGTK